MVFTNTNVASCHLHQQLLLNPVLVGLCIFAIESKDPESVESLGLACSSFFNLLKTRLASGILGVLRLGVDVFCKKKACIVGAAGTKPVELMRKSLKLTVNGETSMLTQCKGT